MDSTKNQMTETQKTIQIPNGSELIDEAFYVWETRFGLFSTMTVQGRKMLTGLKKEDVISMTRWHLKCEIDGTLEEYTRIMGSGVVGGKL